MGGTSANATHSAEADTKSAHSAESGKSVPTENGKGHVLAASVEDTQTEYTSGNQTAVVVGASAGLLALVAVFVGLLMRQRNREHHETTNKENLPSSGGKAFASKEAQNSAMQQITMHNTWINSRKGTPLVDKNHTSITVVSTPSLDTPINVQNALSARKVTFDPEFVQEESEVDAENTPSQLVQKKTAWETPDAVRTLRNGDHEAPPTQPRRGMASKLINMYERAPEEGVPVAETPISNTNTGIETPFRRNPPTYDIEGVEDSPQNGHPKQWFEEETSFSPPESDLKWQESEDSTDGLDDDKLTESQLSRRKAREQSLDYTADFSKFSANFEKMQITPSQWEAQMKNMDAMESESKAPRLYRREVRKQSVDYNPEDPATIPVDPIEVDEEDESVFAITDSIPEEQEDSTSTGTKLKDVSDAIDEMDNASTPKLSTRRKAREQSEDYSASFDFTAQMSATRTELTPFEFTEEQLAQNDHTRPFSRMQRLGARQLTFDPSDNVDAYPNIEAFEHYGITEENEVHVFNKLQRRIAGPEEQSEDEDAVDLQALMDLAEPGAREFRMEEDAAEPLQL